MDDDRDLWPALLPLWIASAVVFFAAVRAREPLGAQATIAAFLTVVLPAVLLRGYIKKV